MPSHGGCFQFLEIIITGHWYSDRVNSGSEIGLKVRWVGGCFLCKQKNPEGLCSSPGPTRIKSSVSAEPRVVHPGGIWDQQMRLSVLWKNRAHRELDVFSGRILRNPDSCIFHGKALKSLTWGLCSLWPALLLPGCGLDCLRSPAKVRSILARPPTPASLEQFPQSCWEADFRPLTLSEIPEQNINSQVWGWAFSFRLTPWRYEVWELKLGEVGGWQTRALWEKQRNSEWDTIVPFTPLLPQPPSNFLPGLCSPEMSVCNYSHHLLTPTSNRRPNTRAPSLTSRRPGESARERRNTEWKNTKMCAWLLEIIKENLKIVRLLFHIMFKMIQIQKYSQLCWGLLSHTELISSTWINDQQMKLLSVHLSITWSGTMTQRVLNVN